MKTARAWKEFYRRERDAMGEAALKALFDRAPIVHAPLGGAGALVFPHTRVKASGYLTAAVANAVIRSGCRRVLALGVLHRAREVDAPILAAIAKGDRTHIDEYRRIHGPGVKDDTGKWVEEFSLDNFGVLLELAAKRHGKPAPKIVARYPLLVGSSTDDFPGIDDLRAMLTADTAIVATTDPVHHGVGYHTPSSDLRARDDSATRDFVRRSINEAFEMLKQRDYRGFNSHAIAMKSDFRDVGPVLAELIDMPTMTSEIIDLELVNYADVLNAPEPTWVAAALVTVTRAS